jgi:ribosomal-protein-serine acetyltransferase
VADDPLMRHVPFEMRTERLLLRAPRFEDGELVCATVRASLPELKAWMAWATDAYGPNDAEQWCRRSAVKFLSRAELAYLIFHGQEHVGNVSLFAFNWKVPACEIGYWLASSHCGKGFMTEAVAAVAGWAFAALGMERIEIRTDQRNERSGRVAERCRFQLEGVLHHDSRHVDGTLRDTRVYARLR